MNADNFTQYLEDPSLLYQISYQELKSLALQYPYCQNLHWLLFQKSFMERSEEWKQNLEKAAMYSIDRQRLYQQAQKLDQKAETEDNFLLAEEFLELKSLDDLQLDEALAPEFAGKERTALQLEFGTEPEEPSPGQNPGPYPPLPGDTEEEEGHEAPFQLDISAGIAPQEEGEPLDEPETLHEPAEPASDQATVQHAEAAGTTAFKVGKELIEACSSLLRSVDELDAPPPAPAAPKKTAGKKAPAGVKKGRPPLPSPELDVLKQKNHSRPVFTHAPIQDETQAVPKPQPKQSFTSWVEQFQSPKVQVRLSELMESKKREESRRKKKKKKGPKKGQPAGVGRLALRSITENKEILSETLAELLANQGEYQRAIKMYEALMLVFPKKSDYFAEKIENLKSK